MYVQVKDSAVPKRETIFGVAHTDDEILFVINDANVDAIGLTIFMTNDEALDLINRLVFHTTIKNATN